MVRLIHSFGDARRRAVKHTPLAKTVSSCVSGSNAGGEAVESTRRVSASSAGLPAPEQSAAQQRDQRRVRARSGEQCRLCILDSRARRWDRHGARRRRARLHHPSHFRACSIPARTVPRALQLQMFGAAFFQLVQVSICVEAASLSNGSDGVLRAEGCQALGGSPRWDVAQACEVHSLEVPHVLCCSLNTREVWRHRASSRWQTGSRATCAMRRREHCRDRS